MKKNLFYMLAASILLCSCATCRNGVVYTKKARWVGGNAKAFQQRHDAKVKRAEAKSNNQKK